MTVNNREIGNILTIEQLKEMDGLPAWSADLGAFGIVNVNAAGMFKDTPFFVGPNFNYDIQKRGLSLYEVTCFGHPLERMRELIEADREGRCVIFKFGIGSTVYRTWVRPDGSHPFVSENKMENVGDLLNAEMWRDAYRTREAAEKALEEMERNRDG